MPAPTEIPSAENSSKSSRRKKVKAILASGTVLGIGAVVTMATWNDSQFAEGNFQAGEYSVVSSAAGSSSDFRDNGSSTESAELKFDARHAAPQDTFTAGLWLKPAADSNYDGEITDIVVDGVGGSQPENFVNVEVRRLSSDADCSKATGGEMIASGANLHNLEYSKETIKLTKSANPVQLCFQVTASDDLVPNEDASATWRIETASVSGE